MDERELETTSKAVPTQPAASPSRSRPMSESNVGDLSGREGNTSATLAGTVAMVQSSPGGGYSKPLPPRKVAASMSQSPPSSHDTNSYSTQARGITVAQSEPPTATEMNASMSIPQKHLGTGSRLLGSSREWQESLNSLIKDQSASHSVPAKRTVSGGDGAVPGAGVAPTWAQQAKRPRTDSDLLPRFTWDAGVVGPTQPPISIRHPRSSGPQPRDPGPRGLASSAPGTGYTDARAAVKEILKVDTGASAQQVRLLGIVSRAESPHVVSKSEPSNRVADVPSQYQNMLEPPKIGSSSIDIMDVFGDDHQFKAREWRNLQKIQGKIDHYVAAYSPHERLDLVQAIGGLLPVSRTRRVALSQMQARIDQRRASNLRVDRNRQHPVRTAVPENRLYIPPRGRDHINGSMEGTANLSEGPGPFNSPKGIHTRLREVDDKPVIVNTGKGREVHIMNLAKGTTEGEVKKFFKGYLVESVTVPTNPNTLRTCGHAFVVLSTRTEAERAISELNKKVFHGHKVTIEFTRPPGAPPAQTAMPSQMFDPFQDPPARALAELGQTSTGPLLQNHAPTVKQERFTPPVFTPLSVVHERLNTPTIIPPTVAQERLITPAANPPFQPHAVVQDALTVLTLPFLNIGQSPQTIKAATNILQEANSLLALYSNVRLAYSAQDMRQG